MFRAVTIVAGLLLLFAAFGHTALADAVVSFDTAGSGLNDSVPGRSHGWEFTVNSPVTVTHLGFFDELADGLLQAHEVGIFNIGGGAPLRLSVLNAGGGDPLLDDFRYLPIVPLPLVVGNTYVIAAHYLNDIDALVTNAAALAVDPAITIQDYRFTPAAGLPGTVNLAYPGLIVNIPPLHRFGPNFQFVPEPSTLAVAAVGFLGLAAFGWRRRKRCLR